MMKTIGYAAAALLLCAAPTAAQDQPEQETAEGEPAQGAAAPEEPAPKRWDVTVDFGVNGSKGNTSLTVLSTGVGIKHLVTDEFRLEWNGSVRYGESEGEVVARNLRSQISFDLNPEEAVSPFFYADLERDPFRRMRVRTDGGAGARYMFWRRGGEEFSVSMATLYSRQDFFPSPTGEITPSRTDARFSARLRLRRNLGDARIEHTTFYRPVYNHLDDYTYDATTRLSTKLNEHISFAVTYLFKHNTTPPIGVGREDQSFQAGVTVQF